MRPIKFRGRDIDTGKFVYGNLLSTVFGTYIYDARGITFNPCDCCMVESKSVAQFVGLDADGREVYEGDVLTFEHDGKCYEYTAGLQPFARNDDGLVHYKFDSLQLKEEKKP